MNVDVPVLVVGGGPAGLAASISLSRCGVPSLLVERRPGTTTHPKATVVNTRTMELFRVWEIEERVRAGGVPPEMLRSISWRTALAGREIGCLSLETRSERLARPRPVSPAAFTACPQDVVEPLLHAQAVTFRGADVRFNTRLADWRQDADGITATLEDRVTGARTPVRADFMVAADGAASPIREALGVVLDGREPLGHVLNIHVRADLRPWVSPRPAGLYWIVNADVSGVFIALEGGTRWLFDTPYAAEAGETVDDYSPERCRAMVRQAAGVPHLAVEVVNVTGWSVARHVARRWRAGRVFLVGDAAHEFPPAGGFGMNSGIQDAHNLAWKLAAVIRGFGAEALLDTYEAERKPVAEWYTELSSRNAVRVSADFKPPREIEEDTAHGATLRDIIAQGIESQREHFDHEGAALGASYASSAVVPDGTPCPEATNPVAEYVPTARPGHRAPHVWLRRGSRRLSTLDFFEGGFTVLAGAQGVRWADAARRVGEDAGVPLTGVVVDAKADIDSLFAATYDIAPDGAALIRPDGYVAWRSHRLVSEPREALAAALGAVVGRPRR